VRESERERERGGDRERERGREREGGRDSMWAMSIPNEPYL